MLWLRSTYRLASLADALCLRLPSQPVRNNDCPFTTGSVLPVCCLLFVVYPKETVLCGAMGDDKRAIDPKTIRKYIWPIITAIASLEQHVVSIVCSYFDYYMTTGLTFASDHTREQVQTRPTQ